ncbi:beta-lactamase-like protein [Schizophyllum commune]
MLLRRAPAASTRGLHWTRRTMGYNNMAITFLGTSSGGGPTEHRNCSSLLVDCCGNGDLWMVDCAEGTTRQFMFTRDVRPMQVKKIFITHMHVDHVMGIIGFLRNILFPLPVLGSGPDRDPNAPPKVHVYGPAGIRNFIRTIFNMTESNSGDRYVAHELLRPGDATTSCAPDVLHMSEAPGRDIAAGEDGLWRGFLTAHGTYGDIVVDAAPIAHRVPSFGYVFRETAPPLRKLVVLGDTSDPAPVAPLCRDPPPSVLVHEATDAHIPPSIDRRQRREPDTVLQRTLARGHSIPAMAGAFARQVRAERLVLNHVGGRFPFPADSTTDWKARIMREFERQATEAWVGVGDPRHKPARRAIVAADFMRVEVQRAR